LIWIKGIVLERSKVKLLVFPTEHEKDAMKIATMLALSAVMFTASISATLAGPCSADIDAMMVKFDAALNAKATGLSAKQQSTVGGRHVQPTPRSAAGAEEKLGVLSPETDEQVRNVMVRARAADQAGDNVACKEALAEVQRVIGP
jgi:mRNA-degrading endonuclease toxin of MazEF toxin-antitoxin module